MGVSRDGAVVEARGRPIIVGALAAIALPGMAHRTADKRGTILRHPKAPTAVEPLAQGRKGPGPQQSKAKRDHGAQIPRKRARASWAASDGLGLHPLQGGRDGREGGREGREGREAREGREG